MGRLIGAKPRAPAPGWYPLRLTTTVRPLVHGGHAIAGRLGRTDLPAWSIAEAWEVCDGAGSVSFVTNGRFAGASLHELVADHPHDLMGDAAVNGSFPLFAKFVDASGTAPVQIDDVDGPGQSVVWHVLDAAPGATIGCGVRDGVTLDQIRDAVLQQDFDEVLRTLPVRPGNTIEIPAGMPYSLGPGVLLYAVAGGPVQEFSLSRWRSEDGSLIGYDEWWGSADAALARCDLDARPRLDPGRPLACDDPDAHGTLLHAGDRLALERWQVADRATIRRATRTAVVITNVGAESTLRAGDDETLPPARTVLVPAAVGTIEIEGPADLLISYVPDPGRPSFGG